MVQVLRLKLLKRLLTLMGARLVPRGVLAHGYTGGFSGRIQLHRGGGVSRHLSEACRSRMEGLLEDCAAGKMRKDQAAARR